jgi:hypothetical protein
LVHQIVAAGFVPRSHCSCQQFKAEKGKSGLTKSSKRLTSTMKPACLPRQRRVLLMVGYCCIVGVRAGEKEFAREKEFVNWHFNRGVGGPYHTIFHPTNGINDPNGTTFNWEEQHQQDEMIDTAETNHSEETTTQAQNVLFPLLTYPLQPQDVGFRSGLKGLKDIVEKAASEGKRLRPYGSRWSLSEIAYSEEYMISRQEEPSCLFPVRSHGWSFVPSSL